MGGDCGICEALPDCGVRKRSLPRGERQRVRRAPVEDEEPLRLVVEEKGVNKGHSGEGTRLFSTCRSCALRSGSARRAR